MIIEKITLLNFKNIEECTLSFSSKINFFFGKNGMGKTNLIDAIYYLSFVKNITHLYDNQLIMHNKEFSILHAFYRSQDRIDEIYCGIKRKKKKIFQRNKKEYDKLSEHIGFIPTVLISPVDIDIIRVGSNERRKFVDMLLSQYDSEYLKYLIFYNKALRHRNALLKKINGSDEELELWEFQMVKFGELIYQKRKNFVIDFSPLFKKYYEFIGDNGEMVGFEYLSHLENNSFIKLLQTNRERDKILGFSNIGIHKDDFIFLLNGYLIRKVGSQGQNKTYLIALKLAQYSFLLKNGSSSPILLLDDLFDKIDEDRVKKIIWLVTQSYFGQIFIANTNRKYFNFFLKSISSSCKLFQVKNGLIEEIVN